MKKLNSLLLLSSFFSTFAVAGEYTYKQSAYFNMPSDRDQLLASQDEIVQDGLDRCGAGCTLSSLRLVKLENSAGNVIATFEAKYARK